MKALVIGSTGYSNLAHVLHVLDTLRPTALVVDGEHGVGAYAEGWAEQHGVPVEIVARDVKRYGNAATQHRDLAFFDAEPDVVLVFAVGKTPSAVVRHALARNVPALRVAEEPRKLARLEAVRRDVEVEP